MPPKLTGTGSTLATLLIATLPLTVSQPLLAQAFARHAPPTQRHSLEPSPALHQSFKACGKKWRRKARKLSAEKLAWMLDKNHRFYEVTVNDRKLLTIELLSTASFRNCDLESEWAKRETTIRVEYFLSDGTTAVNLHHFARDNIFFNQAPKVHAGMGKVLLKGIQVNGKQASRWLELEPLKKDNMRRAADPHADPPARVASRQPRLASVRVPE